MDAHNEIIALFHLPPNYLEYKPNKYFNDDLKLSIGTQAKLYVLPYPELEQYWDSAVHDN